MGADLERHRGRIARVQVMRQRGLHESAERAQRRAGRDRIGRICRHQQRRTIAAPHRTLETARDFHAEQHLARLQQVVELGDSVNLAGEMEIGGILDRFQN